jgi:hypothetical protein
MTFSKPATLGDRFAAGAFGLFTGACYGLVLAAIIALIGTSFPIRVIAIASVVFGAFGFIFGSLVEEAFIGLLHFVWGLVVGWFGTPEVLDAEDLNDHFRGFLLLGFGIGIVLYVWSYL